MGDRATEGFFAGLGDGDAQDLRAIGHRRRFGAGTWLFLEGDAAPDALVLLAGMVKVVTSASDGREVIIDLVMPDALVGELSAIDQSPRSASAVAVDDVEVLAVPAVDFAAFLREHPHVMHRLLVSLTGRLRRTVRRQVELGVGDALGRLCARLDELGRRFGAESGGCVVIRSPLTQSDLAAWSGLSREAVVKSLRRLRDVGWIENEGAHIVLRDPAAIAARSVA